MAPPTRTRAIALPGGRTLTVDDAGDPDGVPVLFLHGTPDSRLARHPDDGVATACGVRLVALDRPGYGGTSPTAGPWSAGWPAAVSADVATALDALAIERCTVLAWSGGALTGVALAATFPDRVAALGIVAGLVPRQAYDDADVRAAGEARLGVIELADIVPPGDLGDEVAPMLAPFPCDLALATEHQAAERSATDAAELAVVPGGAEAMAAGLVEGVRPGLAGVAADIEAQARPLEVDLGAIRGAVRLWYGGADAVTPVAFGRWYERHLPGAALTVVEDGGHYLALTCWAQMLGALAAAA